MQADSLSIQFVELAASRRNRIMKNQAKTTKTQQHSAKASHQWNTKEEEEI